ncbi:MAG: ketoacyl-ACP synthase III [Proteiniphilum sp.]|nr:ketoacyl-ACP synthase III [Proteiniphilum sp.]MDD4799730.1 ketoacyl-ACP synthase III [Proteiniphilum sp.]
MSRIYSIFTGTGSYVPAKQVKNESFLANEFYDSTGERIMTPNESIVQKFEEITTISERRYAEDHQVTSDLALIAAQRAIEAAGVEKEELDYIIFAHNFGETMEDNMRMDVVPSLASRLKRKLGIANPSAIAYDILFGCPGWIQAVIQADYFIRSGDAQKILVVGADILSRVSDPHDRDSMIYADGAGAAIMEGRESNTPVGIMGHNSRSDALDYVQMLHMGYSYNSELAKKKDYYLKMNGRRLYQYALENVPKTIKAGLDKLRISISDIRKVLLHQANGKMDDAILQRLFKLYSLKEVPESIMPMTISWLGNSSVATVPTLLDLITREEMDGHDLKSGDIIVLASVGAGMNINSIVYKIP